MLGLSRISFFCSDLDDTLLGDDCASRRFRDFWSQHSDARRPLLVYSSGRTLDRMMEPVLTGLLPVPDFYVAEVGTRIFDARASRFLAEYEAWIAQDWTPAAAQRVGDAMLQTRPQAESSQSELKRSWYWHCARPAQIESLQTRLHDAGVAAKVVYSSDRYLDIVPQRADKGGALGWLLEKTQTRAAETIVAGDSGNDAAMFAIEEVAGILVSNASRELRDFVSGRPRVYHATQPGPDGVIEGLRVLRAAGRF